MYLQKPGMRNIKTGIGVMLCALVGYLNILDKTLFAAIACIVCMQTTVKGSLIVGINRLKGTFIGGVIGFFICINKAWRSYIILFSCYYNNICLQYFKNK